MSRSFSEHERQAIQEAMLDTGAALLRKKGIRQVSVEDITKGANIAKGSFYSFYNTREELFWDIIKSEERKMVEQILAIAEQELDLKTKARKIFYDLYLNEDSIIYFLPPEDIQYVMRKLPPEMLKRNSDKAHGTIRKILNVCNLEDCEKNIEIIATMLGLLRAARESRVPTTPQVRNAVLDILVNGLTDYFSGETKTTEE